jgi:uncharacterized protein involved in exopolysaccharide biosynthesis
MMQIETRQDLLQSIVYTLFRRKVLIAVTFVVLFGLVMFAGYLMTPTWEAITMLMVQTNANPDVATLSEAQQPGPPNTVASHAQSLTLLLLSREMAYEMVKRFHLDEEQRRKAQQPANFREWFKVTAVNTVMLPITVLQELGVLQKEEKDWVWDAADDFNGGLTPMLEVEVVEGTDVVQVTINGESPEQATEIANTITDRAQEMMRELASQRYRVAHEAYQAKIAGAAARLAAAEKALEAFSREHGGAQIADIITQRTARLETLSGQVDQLVADQEARRRQLEDLASGLVDPDTGALAAGILAAHGSEAELRTQLHQRQSELAMMLTEKTPDHPDVKNLRSQIAQLQAGLVAETRAVTAASDVSLAALERRIAALRNDVAALTELQNEHDRLAAQVQVERGVWQAMLGRSQELQAAAEAAVGDLSFKVLDTAYVSPLRDYDWPSWLIVVALGLFLAPIGAVGLPYFVEYWRDPVKGPRDLRTRGIAVLGVVPPIRQSRRRWGRKSDGA